MTTLAASQKGPWAVRTDGTNVYWSDYFAGTLNFVPVGGGGITTPVTGLVSPSCIDVDTTNFYFGAPGGVYQVPIAGGTPLLLSAGEPASVCTDDVNVYWTDSGAQAGEGTVNSVPIGGGLVTVLATAQSFPVGIRVDGTNVYWANHGTGQILLTPKAGGSAVFVVASDQDDPRALVVLGSVIYWTTYMTGLVMSANADGSSLTQLVDGQVGASSICTDGTNLYWAVVSADPQGGDGPDLSSSIMTSPITSPAPALFATGVVQQLVTDLTNIYWTETGSGDPSTGAVMALPIV